ncbi:MAG: tetratricopeptide repeat protein, partial [Verrucomicrobia bacterium]|nr:tetratricopeptide repeat protein [Verrucomicrobiota bacterium]
MKKADQFLPALLCGSLALGLWAAPLRAQTENPLASVGAAALATPEELSEQEIIRRKEQLIRGQKAFADAEAAMKAGKFDEAAEAYTQAIRTLPKGPVAAKEMAAAKAGVIAAYVNKGKASIRTKNYEEARKAADEVLKLDPANAAAKNIIKTAEQRAATSPEGPKPKTAGAAADLDTVPRTIPSVDEAPEFRKAQNQTTQLLRDARLAFQSNQLDLAAEKVNAAMALDRYNEEARVLLRQINEQRYHTAQVDMTRVRTQYAAETLEAWAPPVRAPRTSPRQSQAPTTVISKEKEMLDRKLDTIRLPKIEFREANIVDVVNFLADQSRIIDKQQGGSGVNIVFGGGLGGGGSAAAPEAAPAVAAPLPAPGPAAAPVPGAVPGAPGAAPVPGAEPVPAPLPAAMPAAPLPAAPAAAPVGGTPAITLNLLDVPLRDALRYVTDIAGLKFIVDKYAVLIVPPTYVQQGALQTRDFQVPPGIFTTVMTGNAPGGAPAGGAPGGAAPAAPMPAATPTAGGGTGVSSEDIKKFFTDAGVKFDTGASVTYQQATSRLFVTNTPDNLDTIESILNTLRRAGGIQVTIEAKFIEIQQTDLRELGFDWIMGDWGFGSIHGSESSVNPAFSMGGGTANSSFGPTFPVYTSDQTPAATATEKITQGNRFASQAGVLSGNKLDSLLAGGTVNATGVQDAVARMTGLLTNPQFQVILRALSQRKNVDLLCAPKVTTISGQQAKIEVVREFIYPTEFEPPRVATASGGSGAASNAPMISPPTPGGFQTRNLGVTLNVTPQIGETGLINLTLIPEVSDFDGFVDYGSRTIAGNTQSANTFALDFPFPQPIFSTRRVTTSVMVFDGSTVVLGGLMREDATKITDKV